MIEVKQTKGIPQRWHIGMAEKGGIFTEKIASVVICVVPSDGGRGPQVEWGNGGGWRVEGTE